MGRDRRLQGLSVALMLFLGGCGTTAYMGTGFHVNKANTCGEVPFLAEVDYTKGRWSIRASHISHLDRGFPVDTRCDTVQDSIYVVYRIW